MKITVCIGDSCHIKGARQVVDQFYKLIARHNLEDKVELCGAFCTGKCQRDVCVMIDGTPYSLRPNDAEKFVEKEVLPRI